MKTVGRITQNTKEPEWALQIPVPQNSQTNMLFNGFCAYFEQKKEQYGAEVIVPEPGVLWGQSIGIPSPVMATNLTIDKNENFQWIESDTTSVLLAIQDNTFCLVTKARLKNDAIKVAKQYFSKNFDESLTQEYQHRNGAQALFEEMTHHDSLATICAESMMKSLRPPEGNIPQTWCQSSTTSSPQLDVNELFPLAMAWRLIDINVAEELVSCVLKLQTNSGAIPILYAPHATHSVLDAPKPLLAKTLEAVWNVRKDDALLTALLPPLRRHLQWQLHHFDPKRRGIHSWRNSTEPIAPETYEPDISTVDLTVLLLTEIEALNRLRHQSSLYKSDPDCFENERIVLQDNLLDQFWNSEDSAFTNAFLRDKVLSVKGLPAFTPLLWDKLPSMHRNIILERVRESGTLPGGLSVLTWRKSALDDKSFPILQQMLVYESLKTADLNGQLLRDFSRISLQGFVEWQSLSLETDSQLHINPVMAAYILNVQSIHQYRYYGKGVITGWLSNALKKVRVNRFDAMIVGAMLFSVFSIHQIYNVWKTPPPLPMLEAEMYSAYAEKNYPQIIKSCMKIITYYPDDSSVAKLYAGNISMFMNNPSDATQMYEMVRKEYPDSPGVMITLGLAYQLQGRFDEAEKNYYEFCYIFDEVFPELVAEVNHFRYLIQEGFTTPPKWQEIYRYQLMNEL